MELVLTVNCKLIVSELKYNCEVGPFITLFFPHFRLFTIYFIILLSAFFYLIAIGQLASIFGRVINHILMT